MEVAISAGKQKPYYIKQAGITDGVYMRVSGTSRKADRAMTQEMYYDSEGRSYDTVICKDFIISDKDIKKLCSDMKEVALANCKNKAQRQSVKDVTKNVLLNWGILSEDKKGVIHPTNAYIFLTGQDAFLSKIQCGMFKGTTRAVFIDKRDRLEITSPGGLMPGVTTERMKEGYSQIRNRALAHAFSYMNLIEGWGTGIPRLFREMKEYGLSEPEIIDMDIALRINLYRASDTIQNTKGKMHESAPKVHEKDKVRSKCSQTRIKCARNSNS